MISKQIFEINGNNFSTLETFYDEISRVLMPDLRIDDWLHLIIAADSDYSSYQGKLPHGILKTDSKSMVQAKLLPKLSGSVDERRVTIHETGPLTTMYCFDGTGTALKMVQICFEGPTKIASSESH